MSDGGQGPSTGESEDKKTNTCGIDINEVNRALRHLTEHLGGGGFGDFRVEGSRSSTDTRHIQLKEVFDLKNTLEGVKQLLEKETKPAHAPGEEIDPAPTSKKTGKMSGNATAAMKNVIAAATDDKFRDLSIKNADLESKLKKSEEKNEKLEGRLEALELRTRGLDFRKLEKKVDKLDVKVGQVQDQDEAMGNAFAQIAALEERAESLESEGSERSIRVEVVNAKVSRLRSDLWQLENKFDDLKTKVLEHPVEREDGTVGDFELRDVLVWLNDAIITSQTKLDIQRNSKLLVEK